MKLQEKITNRLKSLKEIDGISVRITGHTNGTIRILHKRQHSPDFIFRWSRDHYIGYYIDDKGSQSQAIISLYSVMDAIRFVSA